jgi:hypothetical protein
VRYSQELVLLQRRSHSPGPDSQNGPDIDTHNIEVFTGSSRILDYSAMTRSGASADERNLCSGVESRLLLVDKESVWNPNELDIVRPDNQFLGTTLKGEMAKRDQC